MLAVIGAPLLILDGKIGKGGLGGAQTIAQILVALPHVIINHLWHNTNSNHHASLYYQIRQPETPRPSVRSGEVGNIRI